MDWHDRYTRSGVGKFTENEVAGSAVRRVRGGKQIVGVICGDIRLFAF